MKLPGTLSLAFACFSAVISIQAQQNTAPPAARNQIAGTVDSVDVSTKRVSIKSDKGDAVTVQASDRTLVLRIPPGETDAKKGTKIAIDKVSAGDRVVAVSKQPIEGNSVDASAILIMTKGDVAQIQQNLQDDWKKRGVTGTVASIDPAANTVTLKVGSKNMVVQPSAQTEYHRYSPDSARFSDAKPSNFAGIKEGDQLRVLGDKNADGSAIKAEKIVFGTFRQIAATIVSIDTAAGEMKVTDLATKKPLIIRVNSDSAMKKLPELAARGLARRYAPGGARGGEADRGEGDAAAGRGAGRGGDVGQMLDRLPPMPLSDLKAGDAIMATTTIGTDPSKVTATMLLAGVEPLLTASPTATRDIMSGWNLTGGGGEGNQ